MGRTVHFRFINTKDPIEILKKGKEYALTQGMTIVTDKKNHLEVSLPDIQTIDLVWEKVKDIMEAKQNSTNKIQLEMTRIDYGELEDETWFCGGFSKTENATEENHKKVLKLVRFIDKYCDNSSITDF